MDTQINTIASSNTYFFKQIDNEIINQNKDMELFLSNLEEYANQEKKHIFAIQSPLIDVEEIEYNFKEALIILIPNHKITFINFNTDKEQEFTVFYEEIIEDLGSISKTYKYQNEIGRPKTWNNVIHTTSYQGDVLSTLNDTQLTEKKEKRLSELLISLFTGSINDIQKIDGLNTPTNILDLVKKKIVLFDTTQTNFLYKKINKKIITIQGLSGTGKTELLLHKLKELYLEADNNKILFTCHNKVLADSLKKRIPQFFNFMSVKKQIEWHKQLWCNHAWGSYSDKNSGTYSYICHFYGITFYNLKQISSFGEACKKAIEEIENKKNEPEYIEKFAFDYILIDESQDFDENFIKLCELVTKKQIYVAGDVFQSIFGKQPDLTHVDYLLNQCYRTDPKTLMFSHGIGMGLFEERKLQWLSDENWKNYGYLIEKNLEECKYVLSRNPIRRFEDIPTQHNSVELINSSKLKIEDIAKKISDDLKELKDKYPNLKAGDIAIILMTKDFGYSGYFCTLVEKELECLNLNWAINRVFETKNIQSENELCITNHNNVKGLEFPFIICISPTQLDSLPKNRNAIYMALTRSFLQSKLYIPINNAELEQQLQNGLISVNENGNIITKAPTQGEIDTIKQLNLDFDKSSNKSFKDLVESAIGMSELNSSDKELIFNNVYRALGGECFDINKIEEKVKEVKEMLNIR